MPVIEKMAIYYFQEAYILLLFIDKVHIAIIFKNFDYVNIFSLKSVTKLLKYTKTNNHIVSLKKINNHLIALFIAM